VPDRRLVLALADLDPQAAGPRDLDDPDISVVLVVPSLPRLLQAGWLASLRRRPWSTFEDWLRQALTDDTPDTRPGWRYDRAVAGWADAVGPGRVQLVAGDDPAATPGGRPLTWAEVATVDALRAELEALGLTGRNAADLLQGAVEKLVRGLGPDAAPGPAPLSSDLEQRLVEAADAMLASVDETGVTVTGDRSLLRWTAEAGRGDDLVALSAAVDLSIGALERVASWGPKEHA
jgi:hypothetical protein